MIFTEDDKGHKDQISTSILRRPVFLRDLCELLPLCLCV